MKTGWVDTGNGLKPGCMKILMGGTILRENVLYYLNPDGDMKTGWLYDKISAGYLNNDDQV